MKSLFKVSTLAMLSALALSTAKAEGSAVSIGYQIIDADIVELGAISGRYSYDFTANFGIEGELGIGVDDDLGVELDYAAGLFGVAKLPLSENGSDVFIRLGYGEIELSGGGVTASDSGALYGIGSNIMFNNTHGVRLDYLSYEGDADQYGISYVMKF